MAHGGSPLTGGRVGDVVDRAGPVMAGLAVFGLSFLAPATPSQFLTEPAGIPLPVHVVLAGGCAVAAMLARRWRWPLCLAAAVGWLGYGIWPGVAVASYYAATAPWPRARLAAYAAAATAAVAVPGTVAVVRYQAAHELWISLLVVAGVAAALVGLPLVAGLWVTARRQVLAALREHAVRLEHEQAARAEAARAQERARIAREMHDVVAHRVSLMVLHAGALEMHAPDERTATAAALIRTTGRQALTDLRDVLGMLRPPQARLDPQPMLTDLDRLLEQSRSAGIPVARRDEGSARTLPAAVQRAAYRIVQEALTNVHKHAADADTEVVVRYLPDSLEVLVHNTAPAHPAGDAMPGSGLGLIGLAERVEVLGGQLEARPRLDGGFTVLARLPAVAEEPV